MIGALALDPGSYLVAVLQDMDPRGGPPPYVYESISDTYTLLAESTVPDPNAETEPNDQAASATPVQVGRPVSASIGWAGDEDFFCVPRAEAAAVRWTVRASAHDGRALEATPMRGEDAGTAVRIHFGDAAEVASPWQSAPMAAGGAPRCLRVRMAPDAGGAHAGMAYVVEAEAVR